MTAHRGGELALIAAAIPALSAWASNDQARRAAAEVVTVHARLDETTATANANARDVAALESRSAADRALASGMASLRAGEHGQAALELAEFVARYPEHPLAAAAQWWIGEAYYRQRDHAQALIEFQRVVDAYPTREAAARALLRVAQCHQWLGDAARGRAALERVVRDHPNTDAAARARRLLAARSATSRAR